MALGKKKYRAVKLKIDYQRDIYGVVILADADAKMKMSPQKRESSATCRIGRHFAMYVLLLSTDFYAGAVIQSLYLPVLCSAGGPGTPSQGNPLQGGQGALLAQEVGLLRSCQETFDLCLAARS